MTGATPGPGGMEQRDRDGAAGCRGAMERKDGAVTQSSSRPAGPGGERKGWAEPAPGSKALLSLVLPASKDLVGVGGITPSTRLVSPVLTSALGFVTPSLFPVNSKKEKANAKYTHQRKLAREMSCREAGQSFGMWLSSGVGMGWGKGQRRRGGCREMWCLHFWGQAQGTAGSWELQKGTERSAGAKSPSTLVICLGHHSCL